jgi:hypothetical protein
MTDSTITAEDIFGGNDEIKVGDSFTIPSGMSLREAAQVIHDQILAIEMPVELTHEFRYRPEDGAYAAMQVLEKRFGTLLPSESGGRIRRVTTRISLTETVKVPWGFMRLKDLPNAELMFCDGHDNPEYGRVFCLHVTTPKANEPIIEELFDEIEHHLETNSIYRGKAIRGSSNPEFMDLKGLGRDRVIYAEQTARLLDQNVWAVFRHTDAMRRDGMTLKRAILLHGEYGTGKTLTGRATAKEAVENGWTFIAARPDQDDLLATIRMARLYMPCAVFVEDVDTETSSGEDNEVKDMLEEFDGIVKKGGELVVVMTTNHVDRIHKGMLRPGRFDATIEVGTLDRAALEKLVRLYIKKSRLGEIDYDELFSRTTRFTPAFLREITNRAMVAALVRVDGDTDYKVTTEDLIDAVASLEGQFNLMEEAQEGEKAPTLDESLKSSVRGALHGGTVVDLHDRERLEFNLNGSH